MLDEHYTQLIDGYQIKRSGANLSIVSDRGAVMYRTKSEGSAIHELISRRQGYSDGYRAGRADADRLLQEVLHVV